MKFDPAVLWRKNDWRRRHLGSIGQVISYSIVNFGPEQLKQRTPYVVALVSIDDEVVPVQLVECVGEEIRIGMKVKGVLRRMFDVDPDALHVYGVKFAPLREK
jgi:uncharacterized OB-fold protein